MGSKYRSIGILELLTCIAKAWTESPLFPSSSIFNRFRRFSRDRLPWHARLAFCNFCTAPIMLEDQTWMLFSSCNELKRGLWGARSLEAIVTRLQSVRFLRASEAATTIKAEDLKSKSTIIRTGQYQRANCFEISLYQRIMSRRGKKSVWGIKIGISLTSPILAKTWKPELAQSKAARINSNHPCWQPSYGCAR